MLKKRILVVDGEDQILHLIERVLLMAGYEVFKAKLGKEAHEKVQMIMPNLILMDIVLPDMNGTEAVKLIKSHEPSANIPIIFLSGIAFQEGKTQSEVNVSGTLYKALSKPFNPDELLGRIRKMLG